MSNGWRESSSRHPNHSEGLRPSDSPTHSLAGAPKAPLRSRGLTRALVRQRPYWQSNQLYSLPLTDMRPVLQMLGTLMGIVGLLALLGLAFYVAWLIVMFMVSFLPIIGRKHKHQDWNRLQELRRRNDRRG